VCRAGQRTSGTAALLARNVVVGRVDSGFTLPFVGGLSPVPEGRHFDLTFSRSLQGLGLVIDRGRSSSLGAAGWAWSSHRPWLPVRTLDVFGGRDSVAAAQQAHAADGTAGSLFLAL